MINNDALPPKRLPSFNEVIVKCQGLLEKIMTSLSRPFLVEVAQQVCEKVETSNANVQSSTSAPQQSSVKSVLPTSPKSPAQHDVSVSPSKKTCVVTVDMMSEKDVQISRVVKSPAKHLVSMSPSKKTCAVTVDMMSEKNVQISSVVKSPAKHLVSMSPSKKTGAVAVDMSEKDVQISSVVKSPAKQSTQSTVTTGSAVHRSKSADNVTRSESTVRPSTPMSVNNGSDVEMSDVSDTDSIDIEDDDWFRPSSKCAKKSRSKKPWSALEEELVYKGAQAHGVGNWALIRANFVRYRSNVDIKDKWRTMIRQGRLRELACQFGPLPLT